MNGSKEGKAHTPENNVVEVSHNIISVVYVNIGCQGSKGKAGKAMKEQARKQEERKAEGNKTMNKRRQRHFQIQSAETQQRMIDNQKNTEAKYKAKNQKQKKEQSKPRKHKHRKP